MTWPRPQAGLFLLKMVDEVDSGFRAPQEPTQRSLRSYAGIGRKSSPSSSSRSNAQRNACGSCSLIAKAAAAPACDATIDGEAVVCDRAGIADFALLHG